MGKQHMLLLESGRRDLCIGTDFFEIFPRENSSDQNAFFCIYSFKG